MIAENSLYGEDAPTLLVRSEGTDWSLSPGPAYLVGRDPDSGIAISDGRISWQHAVLRLEDGRWVLADNATDWSAQLSAVSCRLGHLDREGSSDVRYRVSPEYTASMW